MIKYIVRRLLVSLLVLWGVSTLVFGMMHALPGDPVEVMLSRSGGSAATIASIRQQLGLDAPLYVQYLRFFANALQGDLGRSISTGMKVTDMIAGQFPATLELASAGMLVALSLGLVLGLIAALKHNSWIDNLCVLLSVIGVSVPIFWLGLLLIQIFAAQLHWLPATGEGDLKHLLLPALVLGFSSAGSIARLLRATMLDVLTQDYMRTARAKGLTEKLVVLRHGARNALIPVVTMIGMQAGFLLGGTVVTETIFSRRGLGQMTINAILWLDFPVVQGAVLVIALTYVLVNLLVDLSYGLLDPRIRYG
ncbi:MAG: ABC transporter permease [Chloroflexi bacterium]|nr:ABC transporter permease [Chloroflexota bacterium]